VIGHVDAKGRAMLPIRLRHPATSSETVLDAWLDTAFTDELVVPSAEIARLGLPKGLGINARLADGSGVKLDTFICKVHWFGKWRRVIASNDRSVLLGIALLRGRKLTID
jgi:predicted aspartyl protease